MDTLSPSQRSERMALVRSKDTKPEMLVRRLVHGMGFRYRLHDRNLPGTPDLVFKGKRKLILVHGCFWHRHRNCGLARMPKSKQDFWREKLDANAARDSNNEKSLLDLGWKTLVLWECELRDVDSLRVKIKSFLQDT